MYPNLPRKSQCCLQGGFSFFRPDSKMLFKHLKIELDICQSFQKHLALQLPDLVRTVYNCFPLKTSSQHFQPNNSYSIPLRCHTKITDSKYPFSLMPVCCFGSVLYVQNTPGQIQTQTVAAHTQISCTHIMQENTFIHPYALHK